MKASLLYCYFAWGTIMSDTQPTRAIRAVALILAAGKSTRMNSKLPKALHPMLGKPLLLHAAEAAQEAGAARVVLVVGHQADQVRAAMGEEYEYVTQTEQKGTGHAVQMAEQALQNWEGPVLVLPGDAPLISPFLLRTLLETHEASGAAATLLTAVLDDAAAYGRIVRDPQTGQVQSIVEARDATPAQLQISEIGTSIYAFQPGPLFRALRALTPQNAQGEYYLTDVIALLAAEGHTIEAVVSPDADIVRGVNNRAELVELTHLLQQRIHRAHLLAGVTILDPLTTLIESTVKIGQDTVVHPFTLLMGVTDIGVDCEIGPGARISDSRLGDGVSVKDSHITASEIGDRTRVGPFANIRPGSIVGQDCKVGDFVELKNAQLGDHVSAGHLAYLGDAEIGPRTNIGAGTITCNYDIFRTPSKNKTVIGAEVFVGSHATLVAPVTVDDGAFVAAGSVITEDVPAGGLGLGRARQVNKEGWATAKRRKKAAV
jgi:bifunctional UDP-N-acetylglucosamine pyrophosphorylase/glucosamine-1-phosphate N-acetyltransferase